MIGIFVVCLFIGTSNGLGLDTVKGIVDEATLTWSYYADQNLGRFVAFQKKGDDTTVDCFISGDRVTVNEIKKLIPGMQLITESKEKMTELTRKCSDGKHKGLFKGGDPKDILSQFGALISAAFIYPGTYWCGAGNISDSYEDLGPEQEADKCCRTHDHCNDSIVAFSSHHGLQNLSPSTISHCRCDFLFLDCLKKADTKTSKRIGMIYFNLLPMKCFKKDHPIKACKQYDGLIDRRCIDYDLDSNKEPTYQYFDDPHFKSQEEGALPGQGISGVFKHVSQNFKSAFSKLVDNL